MRGNFPRCIPFTIGPSANGPLGEEGGWSDRANPTMRGITLSTFRSWCWRLGLPEPDRLALRDIDDVTVVAIYRERYWDMVDGDGLPLGVDLSVFDAGVNTGTETAAMQLQRILRVTADGDIGPITCAAAAVVAPLVLISDLADAQAAYYRSLPEFPESGAGWLARAERRRQAAVAMLAPVG